jgi:hypothetical protein
VLCVFEWRGELIIENCGRPGGARLVFMAEMKNIFRSQFEFQKVIDYPCWHPHGMKPLGELWR